MKHKTYEADRFGRLSIYPSVNPPKRRGFCRRLFEKLRETVRKAA